MCRPSLSSAHPSQLVLCRGEGGSQPLISVWLNREKCSFQLHKECWGPRPGRASSANEARGTMAVGVHLLRLSADLNNHLISGPREWEDGSHSTFVQRRSKASGGRCRPECRRSLTPGQASCAIAVWSNGMLKLCVLYYWQGQTFLDPATINPHIYPIIISINI